MFFILFGGLHLSVSSLFSVKHQFSIRRPSTRQSREISHSAGPVNAFQKLRVNSVRANPPDRRSSMLAPEGSSVSADSHFGETTLQVDVALPAVFRNSIIKTEQMCGKRTKTHNIMPFFVSPEANVQRESTA